MLVKNLIVGADDSNHAGKSKAEIIVAVFSQLYEDGIVSSHKNVRNYEECSKWLKNPFRDYRFAILTSEKYKHSARNLEEITPLLVDNFLGEKTISPLILKIYLDGILSKEGKRFFREKFSKYEGIEEVAVDNFIKKNKKINGNLSKRPRCPLVVYYADILANYLFSQKTFEELSQHKKLVVIK